MGASPRPTDGGCGCPHVRKEWVVPTGIEHDNAQLASALDHRQDLIERYRFEFDITIGFEPGVDRNEIIGAFDCDPVARKVDDGPVSLPGFAGEGLQHLDELFAAEVPHTFDRFKSRSLKHSGKEFRVPQRIGKRAYRRVGGIADDQRNAASPSVENWGKGPRRLPDAALQRSAPRIVPAPSPGLARHRYIWRV